MRRREPQQQNHLDVVRGWKECNAIIFCIEMRVSVYMSTVNIVHRTYTVFFFAKFMNVLRTTLMCTYCSRSTYAAK